MFPSLPPWEGAHVLLVHFPIALLVVSPLFVLLDLIFLRRTAVFGVCALILLVLGTAGAVLAVLSGEAAAEAVVQTSAIHTVLERHEERGELARTVFAALTLAYAALLLIPLAMRKVLPWAAGRALRAFLAVLLLGGAVLVCLTAHDGGLLVHEHGVQATLEK